MPRKPDRLDLVTQADINRELERRIRSEAARILLGPYQAERTKRRLLEEAKPMWKKPRAETSEKKKAASKQNGQRGGRPRKHAPCAYNKNGYHTFAYRDPVTKAFGRCPCGLTLKGEWKIYDQGLNRYRAECWQRDQIGAKWRNLDAKTEEEK